MSPFMLLLFAYGLTFGLQHKAPYLWGKSTFTDALLKCSYCTGFHAGWIVWLAHLASQPDLQWSFFPVVISTVLFAFGSAGFAYFGDVLTQWLELSVSDKMPIEDSEEEDEPDV